MNEELFQGLSANARSTIVRDQVQPSRSFQDEASEDEVGRQETCDFFTQAAAKYDPQAFVDALAAVPDVEPDASDRV